MQSLDKIFYGYIGFEVYYYVWLESHLVIGGSSPVHKSSQMHTCIDVVSQLCSIAVLQAYDSAKKSGDSCDSEVDSSSLKKRKTKDEREVKGKQRRKR